MSYLLTDLIVYPTQFPIKYHLDNLPLFESCTELSLRILPDPEIAETFIPDVVGGVAIGETYALFVFVFGVDDA